MIRNFTCSVCFLFAFFLIHASSLFAQSYDFAASAGTFTPLTGGTALDVIEDDDAISGAIPIGFNFTYFGTAYSSLKASSNGNIQLSPTASSSIYDNSFSFGYAKFIAPLWDDLSGDDPSAAASYKLEGIAGNQILTLEWLNWRWGYQASGPVISFQVKLYESDGKIEFIYRPESGGVTLSDAGASIGLIGNTSDVFYSLSNSTSSPSIDLNGNTAISLKPASGQIYSFTPGAAPVAPTVAASSITASPLGSSTATFSWANGNGAFRAVFIKQTSSTTDFFSPVNGSGYVASSIFGNQYVGSDWYCIYNGTGNSVAVTNLQSTLTYRVQVVEYNGLGGVQQYNATQVANNFVTTLAAPTGAETTVTPLYNNSTEAIFYFQQGNGLRRAIFVKATPSATLAPIDNTTYTANTVFGAGSQVGTSGWYCVYDASISSGNVTITGLSPNTFYYIQAVDYNGSAGSQKYRVAGRSSFTTFTNGPVPDYTFTSSTGTFTPITGGTAINTIENDEGYGAGLIGFNFKFGGVVVNNFYAGANGFLSFNPVANNATGFPPNNLTSSNLRPLLAPFWDDLDGSSGQASYVVTGSAPNRVFTLEFLNWKSFSFSAGGPAISFQIKLYETTNKIEYVYRQEAAALVNPSASIGLAVPNITGSYSFLSLNGTGPTPAMSSTVETSTISAKPATGQIYTFTPVKLSQTITFGALPTKTFGDANFTLGATASSGLTVSYSSSNTAVATVSGNTITIVGGGTTTITANQAGDADYTAATGVQQTLTVNKKAQAITFAPGAINKVTGDSFNPGATSNSGLAVTYSSNNTTVATVSGTTITVVGVGTAEITANQVGNDNYLAAAGVARTLNVTKGSQTITFNTIPNQEFRAATFALTATTPSGLPIAYSSSNTAVATITGSQLTFVGLGATTITASQAGDVNYNAATPVDQSLTVVKGSQTITFNTLPAKNTDDAAFTLGATASSGLVITYTSSNTAVATVSGNTVTIVGAGTTNITASQAGNTLYNAAANVIQSLEVTASKLDQTITFSALDATEFGVAAFDLTGSSSSNLDLTYTSSNTQVATISGKTVTIVGAGTTSITASQAGDATYNPASSVVRDLTVNKADQTITFTAVADKVVGDAPFTLTATSTSSLPVKFSINPFIGNFIELSGENNNTVKILKAGLILITAQQSGNANYNEASAEVSFCIKPVKPTIELANNTLFSSVAQENHWFKDGVDMNLGLPSITLSAAGTYTLVVSAGTCMSDPSDPVKVVITALEDVASLITVSPNPSQKEIRIDLTSLGNEVSANIEIHDLLGRTVHTSRGSGIVLIDISDYQKGNYILGIKSGNKIVTKQISKN